MYGIQPNVNSRTPLIKPRYRIIYTICRCLPQVSLPKRFLRRLYNGNKFLIILNYFPWKEDATLNFNKFESLLPKGAFNKFCPDTVVFRRSEKCEKNEDRQTGTGQRMVKRVHLSFKLG